jgi:hypothetical protein
MLGQLVWLHATHRATWGALTRAQWPRNQY